MIVLKVTINDREMAFSSSKTYGPYPQNKDITISASGKAKDKTFTTQTKTIKASDLKYNTEITLNFDSEDIEDYVEKKEKKKQLEEQIDRILCWIFFSE